MFLFDTRTAAERRADGLAEARKEEAKAMDAIPWDADMPFCLALKIQGKTYKQPSLFNVRSCGPYEQNPNIVYGQCREKFNVSPNKEWAYRERILRAGSVLETRSGRRRGMVCFDSDVRIPMIHHGKKDVYGEMRWSKNPIMSLTPMEFFSLRPGIRIARGNVIVAGLGMGYMLERVCAKQNVKQVTLVEKSQDLVNWILPKLDLGGTEIKTIVGDAYEVVPALSADVALIDIFPTYGGNLERWNFFRKKAAERSVKRHDMFELGTIKKIWIWGA